ncbi:cell division protein CrgA [Nocardioides perillae]|uniref:Cell division protein CrgA n=1 Tax=Nocardioides perillae TaxID=1119534 RepID=A0A7Y9RPI9_9ACTN|nr:FtsH-binding integral membrane protein [Nocardioides perillae]
MAKSKSEQDPLRTDGRPRPSVLSVRSVLALLLFVVGVAWIVYYWTVVRPDGFGEAPGGPGAIADLGRWNYVIGFGAALLGLAVAAHPTTPLGRGRGVVVGMLFCFLVGLIWICTFYVFTNTATDVPVITDLDQWNLVVGIGLMAVGFVYATRWE